MKGLKKMNYDFNYRKILDQMDNLKFSVLKIKT